MSGYQDSSAYAFDMFEEHERVNRQAVTERTAARRSTANAVQSAAKAVRTQPVRRDGADEKPVLRKVAPKAMHQIRREEANSAKKMLMLIGLMAVIFTTVCLQLTVGAEKYELTRKIASTQASIEIAKSENVRLNAELNGVTSITKIDNYAVTVLGMTKLESYQVECIDLSEGDKVLYSGAKTLSVNNASLFNRAKAYLSSLVS